MTGSAVNARTRASRALRRSLARTGANGSAATLPSLSPSPWRLRMDAGHDSSSQAVELDPQDGIGEDVVPAPIVEPALADSAFEREIFHVTPHSSARFGASQRSASASGSPARRA